MTRLEELLDLAVEPVAATSDTGRGITQSGRMS